jgi:hypothetical protein
MSDGALRVSVLAAADRLEGLMQDARVLCGAVGRVNDPLTVAMAQIVVDLRDAADREDNERD